MFGHLAAADISRLNCPTALMAQARGRVERLILTDLFPPGKHKIRLLLKITFIFNQINNAYIPIQAVSGGFPSPWECQSGILLWIAVLFRIYCSVDLDLI